MVLKITVSHTIIGENLTKFIFIGIGLTRAHLRQKKKEKARWRGGVYVVGNWCFEEEQTAKQLVFFYSELFTFKTNSTSDVTVILQVSSTKICLHAKLVWKYTL